MDYVVVFFDLDGTLTDPKLGITGCIRHALAELGMPVPAVEELTWCIGPPLLDSLTTLVGEQHAPAALRLYRERFSTVGLYENAVYPGVVELLAALGTQGVRMFVASSKPLVYVRRIVAHFGLADHFENLYGSELDGTRVDKAELLAYALADAGVPADRATMVGDRHHDIVGAHRNGMRSVGVLYGYGARSELEGAGAMSLACHPSGLADLLVPAEYDDNG